MNASATENVRPPRIFASLLMLVGAVLVIGGFKLALLGGSSYYITAGVALVASAALLWRGDKRGAWLYGALLLATLIWSLLEVGFDGWALAPRLAMLSVLGLWLSLPRTRRKLNGGRLIKPLWRLPSAWLVTAAAIVLIFVGISQNGSPVPHPFEAQNAIGNDDSAEWRHYGRTQAGTRFAPFVNINAENVGKMKIAWMYRTGIGGTFQDTPMQAGDELFLCTAGNVIIALDAENGAERWRFDPKTKPASFGFTDRCRGVTYYRAPDENSTTCPERILTATTDARMFAVNAKTGVPCADFGVNGEISLLSGMGEVTPGYYYVTSPPTIARDVAVLGGWVLDNNRTQEPSGVIRAFDPLTGKLKWAWDMGRPDAHTEPTEGEEYTRGTPNAWSLFSADDALGLVYIPTGNATPDYFGAHRSKAAEKYASSIVALDVATGDVRWSYQTTHHDIWDYDVPSQPVLTKVGDTPAVIVPTKRGELFVFDRRDGTPLANIDEKTVPQTDVPQEWTSKTQPFSTGMPSFAGAPLTEKDTWGLTPIDQMLCRIAFRSLRYEGPLTPPSVDGSIQYPGFAGGMNWGSVSVNEDQQLMVVQSLHLANRVQLTPRDRVTEKTSIGFGGGQQIGTPYLANTMPWLSPIYVPCQRPPYGEMAVVDLKTKRILWQRPLGTANALGPAGLSIGVAIPMGVPYSGGNLVTRSGLIFVGGTMDSHFRAIDLYTGRELWHDHLPGSAQATPMSYLAPQSRRQVVAITVPGEEQSVLAQKHSGDNATIGAASNGGGYVIAYALE